MKMRLAAGVAVLFALGSATLANAGSADRSCREVTGEVPASALKSTYDTGWVRLEKQHGSSVCDGLEGGLYCVLSNPGRLSVTTGRASKTFAVPLLAKARLKVRGDEISCLVL